MRRTALQNRVTRFRREPVVQRRFSRIARPYQMPPPVGGWNAQDSLQGMNPSDAVSLSNWFPRQSDCITRPGFTEHCDTGEVGEVETLLSYEHGANSKLLACVNGKIIDVTTSTPSVLDTGFGSDQWVSTMMAGTMILANGVDTMQNFDGSLLSASTFSGVSLAALNFVTTYKGRVYAVEENSQSMWYGGVGAISGALTEFDFSTVANIKGNLKVLTHLKGDGGDGGQDDIFCAIFAGGDVLAYQGSNPGDATNWGLIGHYRIGRPLSRFGVIKGDDDSYIITSRGYEKLSEMLKYGQSAPQRALFSRKIQLAVNEEIAAIGESDDWQIFLHPLGQMMIITVPRTGNARHMHVRNINTGAWCRFDGFYPHSWALKSDAPYFGSASGVVYAFDEDSTSDNGATIRADGQPAWSSLGMPGYNKHVKMIRPFFLSETNPSTSVNVGVDYQLVTLGPFSVAGAEAVFYYWDEAEWDLAFWTGTEGSFRNWFTRNALGDAIGLRIAVDVSSSRVKWNMTTVLFEPGGLV